MLFFNTQNQVQPIAATPADPIVAIATPEEDRHITLQEGIEWLTGLGCTDVRALGNYLISGVMADGYAFTTDIREHSAVDVWRDRMLAKYADDEAQPQPGLLVGQSDIVRRDFAAMGYELSAKYAIIEWSNGTLGLGWYLTTQPIDPKRNPVTMFWDNGSFIFADKWTQIPYIPNEFCPTRTQSELLDDQLVYWRNRRNDAIASGDDDQEEYCSLFLLTVESLISIQL